MGVEAGQGRQLVALVGGGLSSVLYRREKHMGLKETVLSKIPGWVGFLLLILIGVAFCIVGLINPGLTHPNLVGFFVFGPMCIIIGAFSWLVGGTSRIQDRTGTVGVKVSLADLPWWGWLVDFLLVVVGVVVFLVLT